MVPTFMKRMEPFFTLRNKLPLQIVQVILIIAVISLSGARLLLPNRPPGRSTTMGLGMGAKSLIIISYEILSEHVSGLRRWRSLKAYFILNAMEVVFWAAVVFVLAGILSPLAKYLAVVCYLDWRFEKKHGVHRGSSLTKDQAEPFSTLRSQGSVRV
ncbi:unnamed protein product [Fusarium graminearum]|nr:unnamed protein product [Fusarium graminearum]